MCYDSADLQEAYEAAKTLLGSIWWDDAPKFYLHFPNDPHRQAKYEFTMIQEKLKSDFGNLQLKSDFMDKVYKAKAAYEERRASTLKFHGVTEEDVKNYFEERGSGINKLHHRERFAVTQAIQPFKVIGRHQVHDASDLPDYADFEFKCVPFDGEDIYVPGCYELSYLRYVLRPFELTFHKDEDDDD